MVGHQTVGMDDGSVSFGGGLQIREKPLSILFTFEDSFPLIAPRGNMIPGARILDAKRSSHFHKCTSLSLFFSYHILYNLSIVET